MKTITIFSSKVLKHTALNTAPTHFFLSEWNTRGFNIKMDLQEVGRGCGDWMELAQDRDRWRELVSTVMNFGVP